MQILNKPINDLIPYEKNTKIHNNKQINNVAESIRKYGFVQPIVIDKNNVVVIGHCRLEAAQTIGMDIVPCVCVDELSEEQVKALRIIDNKSNESFWDLAHLAEELTEIDLSDFDFDFGMGYEEFDESDLEREEEKNGKIVIKITFDNLQEYKKIEEELKEIIGDATMTVKMT